ncbi:fimbrial protein [Klebsiella grimontii]|uniref:fimbrial protein n=1 Tax=Klebsiella grimontii TaxID=2058152 RepID=UPI00104D9DC8|nr:fimbrial protein [Klebsiella grimontii]TCZ55665.1 hypothetical protein E0D83_26465 [Klebsiella grimontii]
MSKKYIHLIIFITLYLSNTAVFADNVNLLFTGRIISPPCTFDSVNSDLNPSLGNIPLEKLSQPASNSNEVSFKISLINCPSSTHKVIVNFSGDSYSDNVSIFSNKGTAMNVGVQLKQQGDEWGTSSVHPGSSIIKNIESSSNVINLFLAARAYTQTGNVVPGTIRSSITISFIYQ